MSVTVKQINVDDAWLNLDPYIDKEQLFNPLDYIYNLCGEDKSQLPEKLAWLMTRPEYFSFTCKYIFNVEIPPLQALLLYDMWNHKFPILIGSRGLGKMLRPEELLRVQNGWKSMEDIKVGDFVYGGNGKLTKVIAKTELQKNLNFYKITLRDGRTIECCEDHLWKVWDKNKNRNSKTANWSVISTKEMVKNYFVVRKDSKSKDYKLTKEYRFALPINDPLECETSKDLPIHPYVLGVLLGDGGMTTSGIVITSADKELVDRFESLLPYGYKLSSHDNGLAYRIIRSDKTVEPFYKLLEGLNLLGCGSHDKFIPENYLRGSIAQREELLKGLMDTDGCSSQAANVYYTVSDKLCENFLDLARSLGLHCKKCVRQSWFNGYRYADCNVVRIYTDRPIFSLTRKLDNYINHVKSKAGRSKYEKVFITNIEPIGKGDGYCIEVDNEDRTYLTKDYIVTHNSFVLALYSMLRAFLLPARKVVVVGAGFRQSKFLFDYCMHIWSNAPVLRDLCDSNSGCFKDVDRCTVKLNSGSITFLPLGDGTRIRGQRANDIISDEQACLGSSTLIQTDEGVIRISDYLKGNVLALLNKDREFEIPECIFKTPLTDVYKVTTQNGYSFKCSSKHQTMTTKGWKLSKDLTVDDNMILETNDYFPERYEAYGGIILDESIGWLLGLLVSEGTCTNRNFINITNTDYSLIEKVKNKYNFEWAEYHKNAYVDKRGWNCKESWNIRYCNTKFRTSLRKMGLAYVTGHKKTIPKAILKAPRSVVVEFLSGLFEGDGTAYNYYEHSKKRVGIAYYSVNRNLVHELQILLLKFGITCSITRRKGRASKRLQYILVLRGESAYKIYKLLNVLKWKDKFNDADFLVKKPNIVIVTKKTTRYYLSTTEGNKNKYLGSFDSREAAESYFYEYQKNRNFVFRIKSVEKLKKKECLYDFYLPKTNSFIGNGFIQHNSVPKEIFETVVTGFAAVSSSPIEKLKQKARRKRAKEYSVLIGEEDSSDFNKGNQIIMSGTAFYDFNHFADYWKRQHKIICSKGDPDKIREVFNGEIPEDFDWTQYSIYRIPFDMLPEGLMDNEVVARAKATVHSGIYEMEYGAVFSTDSRGFFKRTLIESCVCSEKKPIILPSGEVFFDPMMRGNPNKQYIIGVDPASEVDNFSIVVLELNEDHRRVVYCWTTTRQRFRDTLKSGLTDEEDFYGYCARKIRNLMKLFNTVEIALDPQGGGVAIMESLHDRNKLKSGEMPLWPKIIPDKPADTDDEAGLHIINLCNFSSAIWTSEANHGLRKDMEDRVLIFPFFDAASIGLSLEDDKLKKRFTDTYEDCVFDLEELKNELSLIVISITPSGRERWDTPDPRGGRKDKLRKDRYSALLMANDAARRLLVERVGIKYEEDYYKSVGFATRFGDRGNSGDAGYSGPAWFVDGMKNLY